MQWLAKGHTTLVDKTSFYDNGSSAELTLASMNFKPKRCEHALKRRNSGEQHRCFCMLIAPALHYWKKRNYLPKNINIKKVDIGKLENAISEFFHKNEERTK